MHAAALSDATDLGQIAATTTTTTTTLSLCPLVERNGFTALLRQLLNRQHRPPATSRDAMMGAGVLALHIAFIWALQNGLFLRAAEIVIPAEMLAQLVPSAADPVPTQPVPKPPVPTPHQPPQPPQPRRASTVTAAAAASPLKPHPLTINDTTSSVDAPNRETSQPVQSAAAAFVAVAAAPAAPTAKSAAATPSKSEQPSVDARYSDQDQTVTPP